MDEHLAFLEALASNPDDDAVWQVFADWLEERGDPRSAFIRQTIALSQGAIAPQQAEAAAEQLATLGDRIEPEWLARVLRLRAARRLRFRITDVHRLGEVPPREMLDRAMTVLIGVLESGTVRVGDKVALPLEKGGYVQETVTHLVTFAKSYEELSAGKEPLCFGMMWMGHRLADLGIQHWGLVVRPSSRPRPAEQPGVEN
jgi:uncharacterized protein (TIGR02996 family)